MNSAKRDRSSLDNEEEKEFGTLYFKKKTFKAFITFLDLPSEIVDLIFLHLSRTDIINLSSICSSYREFLSDRVLHNVKASWEMLLKEADGKTKFLLEHKLQVQQLHISEPNSLCEWNLDIFEDVLRRLPKLRHLKINTTSSSNWLKYRSNDAIQELTLYLNRPQTLLRGSRLEVPRRSFNIEHINNFKMLRALTVYRYNFLWDSMEVVYPVMMLENLKVINCDWSYPFKISQFNYNHSLKTLHLEWLETDQFLLSERFKDFSQFDDEGLQSIESLAIVINSAVSRDSRDSMGSYGENGEISNNDFEVNVSGNNNGNSDHDYIWRVLIAVQEPFVQKLLDTKRFPNLRSLHLSGFELVVESSSWLAECLKNNSTLQSFKLECAGLRMDASIQYADVQRKCRRENPDKEVIIKHIDR